MAADAFFLPAFLILGIVSTFQDFRVRRISNAWIVLSLVYVAIVHLYLFISADQQETVWFLRSFVNVLASTFVAVFFWKQNWWGGGDAKLFVCYSALIPLAKYPFGYFSYYFASFLLLVITFVPAAIWTFFHAQFSLTKAGKSMYYNFRLARVGEFLQFGFGFTAIFFLWNLIVQFCGHYFYWVKDLPIVIWLLGIGYYKTILRLFQKRLWLVVVSWIAAISIAVFVPFFDQTNVWRVLINSFASWVIIFILRKHMLRTIEYYVEWTKNNNVAFAGWMFLGGLVIWFSGMILARI